MKATAFLTIATASSLPAPSAAAAAPTKASVAARADISGFLDQMFTVYLRSTGWAGDQATAPPKNCQKRANLPLKLPIRRATGAQTGGPGGYPNGKRPVEGPMSSGLFSVAGPRSRGALRPGCTPKILLRPAEPA